MLEERSGYMRGSITFLNRNFLSNDKDSDMSPPDDYRHTMNINNNFDDPEGDFLSSIKTPKFLGKMDPNN
jgi:hypothetical protein